MPAMRLRHCQQTDSCITCWTQAAFAAAAAICRPAAALLLQLRERPAQLMQEGGLRRRPCMAASHVHGLVRRCHALLYAFSALWEGQPPLPCLSTSKHCLAIHKLRHQFGCLALQSTALSYTT
jgi:hypothetical protein